MVGGGGKDGRKERREGEEGGKGASAARARRERLRRPWGSCTARPRAASRETSRGGFRREPNAGAKILPRFGSAHVRGPRAGAPGPSGALRACALRRPPPAGAGPRFSRRKGGKGERARGKMAAALPP